MMLVLLILVCLGFSFVLGGCEAALMAVSRVRVRHAAQEGDGRALALLPLVEDRDAMLGVVTVANHLASLGAFLMVAWVAVSWWGGWGYAVAFVVALPVFLVMLEILPKKLFRRYPFRSLRYALPLLLAVGWFRFLFRAWGEVVKAPGETAEQRQTAEVLRADLGVLTAKLIESGQISGSGAGLVRRVLEFKRLKAGDLMVPLRRQVALAGDVPLRLALEMVRSEAVEEMLVLGENGRYAGVFEVTKCPARVNADALVRQYMRTLEEVREDEPALTVLQRLRRRGRVVALVLGRDGAAVGMLREEALIGALLGKKVG
jgi:CBS domain containing-hemolysin-like protein